MAKECCVLILAATIVALALRLPRLDQRPMHGDEAVHADKFRMLLEQSYYEYDPNEYHGPTLNYLTLIPARLEGAANLTQVSEFTLRVVPVFFGVCLILLLLPIARSMGTAAVFCAALLTAISPAMVYFSRYYIQEMLLVCFTFGAIVSGHRCARSGSIGWAILCGMFLGLMHATKETCVIAYAAMFLALLLEFSIQRRKGSITNARDVIGWPHVIAGLMAGVLVSALFFSSFLSHPTGVLDSIRTYTTYLDRAGSTPLHIHPWHYYLRMLLYFQYADGPVWTEASIILLAVVGSISGFTRKNLSGASSGLVRFLAFYTMTMTFVYSAIPYKTPWCFLGFLHGMILLAGVGAVVLVRLAPKGVPRVIVILLLVAASAHLAWQAYEGSYTYDADSRNPYVYAHPTKEVFAVVEKIEQYAAAHKDGRDMPIEIICAGGDYWPLPWYLRSFTRVSWSSEVVNSTSAAPLIITSASPEIEAALAYKLYTLIPPGERKIYMYLFDKPYYMWLRPQVKLLGFVRRDLWTAVHEQQEPEVLIQKEGEE